jgi:hypothetical protein
MTMNFTARAGDTTPVYVTILDETTGSVMNLLGVTARWAASPGIPRRFSPTAVITKETGAGIEITNAAQGILRIDLDPADTQDLAGDFYHELQITDSSGGVSTPLSGLLTITRQLVRPA